MLLLTTPLLTEPTTPPPSNLTYLLSEVAPPSLSDQIQQRRLQSVPQNVITTFSLDVTETYQPVDLAHTIHLESNGYFLVTQACTRTDDSSQRHLICLTAYNATSNQLIYQKVYGEPASSTFYRPIKTVELPVFPYTVITAANIDAGGNHLGAIFFGVLPDNGHLFFYQRLDRSSDRLTDIAVSNDAIYLAGNNGVDQQVRKINAQDQTTLFSKLYPEAGTSQNKRGLFWDSIADLLLLGGTEPSSFCRDNTFNMNRYATLLAINTSTGNLTAPIFKFLEDKRSIFMDVVRFDNNYVATCRTHTRCSDSSQLAIGLVGIDLALSQRTFGISYFGYAQNLPRIHVANNVLLAIVHQVFTNTGANFLQAIRLLQKDRLDNTGWTGYTVDFPTVDRLNWRLVSTEIDFSGKAVITFVDQSDRRHGGVVYTTTLSEADFAYCGDLTTPLGMGVGSDGDALIGKLVNSSAIPTFAYNSLFVEIASVYGLYVESLCGPTRGPTKSPTLPTKAPTLRPTNPTNAPSIPPTVGTAAPSDTPTRSPSFAPTYSPTKNYRNYLSYKKSIEGVDIVHGINFLENRHPVLVVENEEAGLWWMESDEANQLLFATKVNVEGADGLHPHALTPGFGGGRNAGITFSGQRVGNNQRLLFFLVLNRGGYVQATSYLLGQNIAGYAGLLPAYNTTYLYNARVRKSRQEERLLLGTYSVGKYRTTAYQSTAYVRVWNRGIKAVGDGSYYGVCTILATEGGRSLLFYYELLGLFPTWRFGRMRYVGSSIYNLHATSFSLSRQRALWTLHVPIKQRPFTALVIEITPTYKKGQIYALSAPKGSIYLTAIELVPSYEAAQAGATFIFIAGYTNQVPLLGKSALCLARYSSHFVLDWAYAYNTSVLEYTEVFLKAYQQGIYVAASTTIGVLELLFNASTGALKGHTRYPIELVLINYTNNDSFYQLSPPRPAFKQIGVSFKNYTVTLREKADFGLIPVTSRRVRKQSKRKDLLGKTQTPLIGVGATIGGICLVGALYWLLHRCKRHKRAQPTKHVTRVRSTSSRPSLSIADSEVGLYAVDE